MADKDTKRTPTIMIGDAAEGSDPVVNLKVKDATPDAALKQIQKGLAQVAKTPVNEEKGQYGINRVSVLIRCYRDEE